jgi:NAD-dependent DNA ligase
MDTFKRTFDPRRVAVMNHRTRSAIAEFNGLASAMVYDGGIVDSEIKLLQVWLGRHDELLGAWPLCDISKIVRDASKDGTISQEERMQIFEYLQAFAKSEAQDTSVPAIFDDNPRVEFKGKRYLFTGEMVFGDRDRAERAVMDRHGIVHHGIRLDTDYLVVGDKGSDEWVHGKYGTKIEKAMQYRRDGKSTTQIIRETDFVKAIMDKCSKGTQ